MTEIWLYTQSWNEERVLPFFFRHYDRWIDRYIVYDDGSTDRTLEMFAAHPNVEVRRFERLVADSFVGSAMVLHNTVWKEARGKADWVVITAIDEHLHHSDILDYLARCRTAGVSAIPALGFQMLADRFPDSTEWLAASECIGAPYIEMNKLSIFDPNLIEETNFALAACRSSFAGNYRRHVAFAGTTAPDAEQGFHFSLDFARAIPTHGLPRANTPKHIANRTIQLEFAPARANIRFMFHAMVTRLHSPRTLSRPRSMNWRNPITDLMIPNTGSGVCLRRA